MPCFSRSSRDEPSRFQAPAFFRPRSALLSKGDRLHADRIGQRVFHNRTEAVMGDKSPKAKQRDKNQKTAAKAQDKTNQAKRQASFSATAGKDKKQ